MAKLYWIIGRLGFFAGAGVLVVSLEWESVSASKCEPKGSPNRRVSTAGADGAAGQGEALGEAGCEAGEAPKPKVSGRYSPDWIGVKRTDLARPTVARTAPAALARLPMHFPRVDVLGSPQVRLATAGAYGGPAITEMKWGGLLGPAARKDGTPRRATRGAVATRVRFERPGRQRELSAWSRAGPRRRAAPAQRARLSGEILLRVPLGKSAISAPRCWKF
jgi:hypothetical protein